MYTSVRQNKEKDKYRQLTKISCDILLKQSSRDECEQFFFSFRFPRRDTGDAEIQAHLPIIQIYQTLLLVVTSRCGQNVAVLVNPVAGILAFPVLSTQCLCKSSSSIKCITCDER